MEGAEVGVGTLEGGCERLVKSSVSLSSCRMMAEGCKWAGGQRWLGMHLQWKIPLHLAHVFLFLVRPSR